MTDAIEHAAQLVRAGGVIACPTEAVYGFGCDPFNEAAVTRIATIKGRSLDKGFIVVASAWQQVAALVASLDKVTQQRIFASWPGAITWVLPANPEVPYWIRCRHGSIAIRITSHPIVKGICEAAGSAMISTSANHANQSPVRDFGELTAGFADQIDYLVPGSLGSGLKPTPMYDALTNRQLR